MQHRNKTLNGGRAERNEYILLHEFHKLKYVVPDKTWGKKAAIAAKQDTEEGHEADVQPKDGAGKGTKNKNKNNRDKYKGGLVLEPKRQLYDKLILVMDFNSLYPSIIQEYNIDFTTVQSVLPNEVRLDTNFIFFKTRFDTDCFRRMEKSRSRLYLRLISNQVFCPGLSRNWSIDASESRRC